VECVTPVGLKTPLCK